MEKYKYYNDEFRRLAELLSLIGITLYQKDGYIRYALDVFDEIKMSDADESLKDEIWKQVKIAVDSLQ